MGDQRRLRRACASAQSRQSLRCSHTWSMEVDEESDKKSDIWPHWMAAHECLKNEFTEDKRAIISWTGSIGRRRWLISHLLPEADLLIYWLTKETLQTFFANGSNRNVENWYLLYSNKWIIATKLFASSIIVVYDWPFMRWRRLLKQHLMPPRLITWPILMQNVFHAFLSWVMIKKNTKPLHWILPTRLHGNLKISQ